MIAAGTRLGPYEIVSQLGAGGMGEVYRAKDTRLNRTVAIKVLPAQVTDRSDLRQRFEREAHAVSSLNHPHICTLHDIGHQNGIDYLVMEYLEGETLANRLLKGALPLEQVLRYGIEIADALDHAHRHGITHRDLKPGNVMLTRSGAKVLDFGLAKLRGPEPVMSSQSSLPTEARALTDKGTLLGTLQYMAPEQLEGQDADARTDIFTFGTVIYEMATGRKAFEGKSQASLIAAILEHEPGPLSTLQPMTPPALDRVVKKCLAKDPEERWYSAHDLKDELKWIAESGPQSGVAAMILTQRKSRERLAWTMVAVLLLAALPFVLAYTRRVPVEVRAVRFTIPAPEKLSLRLSQSISPDGQRLVFGTLDAEDKKLLWVRPLDSPSTQPLPGTNGALFPFWSPDSRSIGFFAEGKLKKLEVSGGVPQTLCDAPVGQGGTWNRDGVVLFASSRNEPLYRVSAAGGKATAVTTLDLSRQERAHLFPQFLPDGHHFLYLAESLQKQNSAVYVGSLDSKEIKRILGTSSNVAYAAPGYLLYLREGMLMAQPFDVRRLQLTGEPFPVAQQLVREEEYASFSASDNGVLVYRSGRQLPNTQLVWLDRVGKQLGLIGPPGPYSSPWLSPDEKRVAVERVHPENLVRDIWLFDLARGSSSRFTFGPSDDGNAIWSPDGSRIVFSSKREGSFNLYQKPSSGAGSEEVLHKSNNYEAPDDWSSDGRFIAYLGNDPKTLRDVWVLPLFGEPKPIQYLRTEFNEFHARFSPDGHWIAYTSDESGRPEVYVQGFPTAGGKWPVSTGGGADPRWRRDGKELFYLAADLKLMAVEVKLGSAFQAGSPRALFQTRVTSLTYIRNHYDVTKDGQRFLVNNVTEESASTPITVVLNWTAELRP